MDPGDAGEPRQQVGLTHAAPDVIVRELPAEDQRDAHVHRVDGAIDQALAGGVEDQRIGVQLAELGEDLGLEELPGVEAALQRYGHGLRDARGVVAQVRDDGALLGDVSALMRDRGDIEPHVSEGISLGRAHPGRPASGSA